MKNSFKLFILAHKNNRGIHKRIVYTVIMILLFLLLIIPFSIFKTYDNELKRFENEDDSAKIISFYYDEKENYEKIKNKVEESKYFIKEKDYTMPFKNGYFEEISDSMSDDIYIYPYIYEKDIVSGINIKNESEIICSSLLRTNYFENTKSKDLIDMKKYLGKTLNFKTAKIVYDEEINDYKNIYFTYKFKLTGLIYDSSNSKCYINEEKFDEIITETFPEIPMQKEIGIYTTSNEGAKTIAKIFDSNNMFYNLSEVDTNFIYLIRNISFILSALFFVLLLIMFNIYIKVFIKEKEKTLNLYNFLGYSKNDLNKIILFSFYEIVAFSLMITLLICLIIKICFSIYFKSTADYMYVKASLYVLPVFIMLFILIILSIFIVNKENKKLYKRMKL